MDLDGASETQMVEDARRLIRQLLPAWSPRAELDVIEGADHFYVGFTAALEESLLKGLEG